MLFFTCLHCDSNFSQADKDSLRRAGFILAHSLRGQPIPVGRDIRQLVTAVSTVKKQREVITGTQLTPFHHILTPSPWMKPLKWVFLLLNLSGATFIPRGVSQVIPKPVKLTMARNPCTSIATFLPPMI